VREELAPLTIAELLRYHERTAKDMRQRARHAATSKANAAYRDFKVHAIFHRRAVALLKDLGPPEFAYWREVVGEPKPRTLAEQQKEWRGVWNAVDNDAPTPALNTEGQP